MTEPMRINQEYYTYADILSWPEGERWELIDGIAFDMSPAPSGRHQEIVLAIAAQLFNILEKSPCRVFVAPYDVRFPRSTESILTTSTVLQPDISVVCDREKLDDHGCVGAPTLVIEVLSPDTAIRDRREKFHIYERAGVPEYWIVSPTERTVMVFTLEVSGRYGVPVVFGNDEQVPVGVLEGVLVNLARVFPAEPPKNPSPSGEKRI